MKRFESVNEWSHPLALLIYRVPYLRSDVTFHHWWRLAGNPRSLSLTLDRAFLPLMFRVSSSWQARPFVQFGCAGREQLVSAMPVECFNESSKLEALGFSVVPAGKRFDVRFSDEGGLHG